MNWTQENKEKIHYITSIGAFFIGIMLCVADFIIEPPGEIHSTSLYFLGEMIAFCGAVFGISLHYENQLNNFKHKIDQHISNAQTN